LVVVGRLQGRRRAGGICHVDVLVLWVIFAVVVPGVEGVIVVGILVDVGRLVVVVGGVIGAHHWREIREVTTVTFHLHSIGHLFKNSTISNYFLNFKKKKKIQISTVTKKKFKNFQIKIHKFLINKSIKSPLVPLNPNQKGFRIGKY
jgi:hypothetical protein